MTILVLGANGRTGRELLALLPKDTVAGLRQVATAEFQKTFQNPTALLDVLHHEQCEQLIRSLKPHTVISLFGGKNEKGERSDATGNINLINACQKHSPDTRFILITSIGCGEQWQDMSEKFKRHLGEGSQAKTQAEEYLRQSNLNWVILRPCGLTSGENRHFKLHPESAPTPHGYMDRKGLARAIKFVMDDVSLNNKVFSVTQD